MYVRIGGVGTYLYLDVCASRCPSVHRARAPSAIVSVVFEIGGFLLIRWISEKEEEGNGEQLTRGRREDEDEEVVVYVDNNT